MRTLLVASVIVVCFLVLAVSPESRDNSVKLLSLSKREVGIQQLSDDEKSREKRSRYGGRYCRVPVRCSHGYHHRCRKTVLCDRSDWWYRRRWYRRWSDRRTWYRRRWYRRGSYGRRSYGRRRRWG